MKKKLLVGMLVFFCAVKVFAGHIAGGEIFYKRIGAGNLPNNNRYEITLRLFRECNPVGAAAELPDDVLLSIFQGANKSAIAVVSARRASFSVLNHSAAFSCIKFPPEVCYQVATYTFTTQLRIIPEDYIIAYQTCCRTNSAINIIRQPLPDSDMEIEGATYTCEIPGTNRLGTAINSSPVFSLKDTVFLCAGKKVSLDFSATDPDNDSLSYSFRAAYNRGSAESAESVKASSPPYASVTYNIGFSGAYPLGQKVFINSKTGFISGLTPKAGAYVVNVCVSEWRAGNLLGVHRKDFIVRVNNCDIPSAVLPPVTVNCDSLTVSFTNESTSASINSYLWDFGSVNYKTTEPQPVFTFQDTGTYEVKLVVNPGEECTDSAVTLVKVYPGFYPDFTISGSCYTSPFEFRDVTTTAYGVVNNWNWEFDNNFLDDEISFANNISQKFYDLGNHSVRLIVGSDKGCIDTVTKSFQVRDKLKIILPFTDTLICKNDRLLLSAVAEEPSVYSWTPLTNIDGAGTQSPVVFPGDTTLYTVTANTGKGCINSDSIRVNVVDHATLDIGNDTLICLTDTVYFHPVSNALHFAWSNDNTLSNPASKNTVAVPVTPLVTYSLRATISPKCFADDNITIQAPPYPEADAGKDISVCFGNAAQLRASYSGSLFSWSPVSTLQYINTITPIAGPQTTTTYVLSVKNTSLLSCPKPVYDSVMVRVVSLPVVFAGNDTNMVIKQILQLHATGAVNYSWQPAANLTDPYSREPTVIFSKIPDSITFRVKGTTVEGCTGYDSVTVFVYKALPDIFIPGAFTPDADGLNDKLIPITAGIKKLDRFSIYNRWGKLLYSTSTIGEGWDGFANGTMQPGGTYVYFAKATDYLGKPLFKKGTIVLIK